MNQLVIDYVWEHNGDDSLIYADNFPGAFVRGKSKEEALSKFTDEIKSYIMWRDSVDFDGIIALNEVGEHITSLNVCDADSEAIFESEQLPLTESEYAELKSLALKSAEYFQRLYDSIPNKNITCNPKRDTFYGAIPVTASEMYVHTKNVNEYYFAQIGIDADNEPDIYTCREKAFNILENQSDYLQNTVFDGAYNEKWSLRKVLRRFIWHDRIHAKAMWRMAVKLFGAKNIENPFYFS
ncbi:MAG: hypothetical protein J1F23_06855 [Oscillospiraceae bacterium]|nr:hypothetical protein [Oscillospiraceae bacterium]